jgi:plastocyanin
MILGLATGVLPAFAETVDLQFNFPSPSPNPLTIMAGDSVRFLGNGPAANHPLQQVDGPNSDNPVTNGFASTSMPYTVNFTTPGTYYYRCTIHGNAVGGFGMRGSIVVQAAGSGGPTPTPTSTPIGGECSGKPAKPVLLTPAAAAQVTKGKISLDWEDTPCATRYSVILRKGKKTGTIVDQKSVTRSQYRTIKLSSKGKYFWSVQACNRQKCSGSSTTSFTIK